MYQDGRKKLNLILHCGAQLVEKDSEELCREPIPMGDRHHPIPHIELIEYIQVAAKERGLNIVQEAYGATELGAKAFGIMELETEAQDYSKMLGFRASYNQTLGALISTGMQVTVCDNLMMTGEKSVKARLTKNIRDRLVVGINRTMDSLYKQSQNLPEKIERYKATKITEGEAFETIGRLVYDGVIPQTQFKKVVNEYKVPLHPEFGESENVWRLHNAVTEQFKPQTNYKNAPVLATLPKKGKLLTQHCDRLAA